MSIDPKVLGMKFKVDRIQVPPKSKAGSDGKPVKAAPFGQKLTPKAKG